MKDTFTHIVNNGHWQSTGTVCGHGSTLQYTDYMRKELSAFLTKHAITSMFDAPCGDYNWMNTVQLPPALRYIGGDIVDSLIEKNQLRHPHVDFQVFDITQDPLPNVDLLFCRDCLIHFSYNDIQLVFENIARSSVKYVLMTNYKHGSNQDISTGGFRGVNFIQAPYEFPPAIDSIEDWIPGYAPRAMCLWPRETIIEYLNR